MAETTKAAPAPQTDVLDDVVVRDEPEKAPEPPKTQKVVELPTAKIGEIKARAAEKARKEAEAEREDQAKDLGYSSYQEMLEELRKTRSKPAPKPAAKQSRSRDVDEDDEPEEKPARSTRRAARDEDDEPEEKPARSRSRNKDLSDPAEVERLKSDYDNQLRELNRQYKAEQRKSKQYEEEKEQILAEHELNLKAARAGIEDPEYAVRLLMKEVQGLSEEELEKFDEDKWFRETLREKKPALFADAPAKPATTGAPVSGKTASPAKVLQEQAKGARRHAREMDASEFEAAKRKYGIDPDRLDR